MSEASYTRADEVRTDAGSSGRTERIKTVSLEKDTWTLALPAELCRREGFAEGTLACLTFKNGAVQTSLIAPSEKARQAAERFIGKYGDFMKEMEELGD